ncbi:MAG: DUF4189 domain-containing protein [Actinomycetota bacterium]|nr:DUF4189 domain-containing protein [Actinomycetota bacterium]
MTVGLTRLRTTIAMTAAALLTAACLTVLAPAAGAASPGAPTNERSARALYGAIALAADGAVGYTYDLHTKRAALRAAHKQCRQRSDYAGTCTKVGWIRNACGAVAVKFRPSGFVSRYKFGWGRTKRAAVEEAKRGFGGQIGAWVCTSRP